MNYERFFIYEATCTTMDIYSYTLSAAELTRSVGWDEGTRSVGTRARGDEFALVPDLQRRGRKEAFAPLLGHLGDSKRDNR
jgi:hypothetical protein